MTGKKSLCELIFTNTNVFCQNLPVALPQYRPSRRTRGQGTRIVIPSFSVPRPALCIGISLSTSAATNFWPLFRAGLFALATVLIAQSLFAQSPRLELIQAMLQRPNDPWPRGKGHVVLAVPGCSGASKGYHEPGGSFSPGFGSLGISILITDSEG